MEIYEKSIADEIQNDLIKKVQELEKREIKFPDYTPQFEALKSAINQQNTQYPAEKFQSQLDDFGVKIDLIPKAIPIKHILDVKTKKVLKVFVILILIVIVSVGIAVHLLFRNHGLQAGADKFHMIRQSHAAIALWADTTYLADPEAALKKADSLEAMAADLAAAQREAMEKKQASDLAKQKVDELRRTKRQSNKKNHR
jgi:hypothetical protein